MTGPVVDVHAHVLVGEVEAVVAGHPGLEEHRALDLRRNGTESAEISGRMVGARIPRLTQVEPRLADMDTAGVDVQVISPSPSHYHYWADRELGATVARVANRGVAAVVAEEPARFTGLGLVPLQHPDLCVAALDDARWCSCTPSAARSTSGWTGSTWPTPSGSRWRTPWRSRT